MAMVSVRQNFYQRAWKKVSGTRMLSTAHSLSPPQLVTSSMLYCEIVESGPSNVSDCLPRN